MSQDHESVRVEIYDQAYNLRGPDAEHIRKLAEIVDAKMRSVAEHTSTVDSLRVAVLAALNLADEYTTLKKKYETIAGEYHARTAHLQNALDSAMDEIGKDRRAG
jgi:cell division protein ZapA